MASVIVEHLYLVAMRRLKEDNYNLKTSLNNSKQESDGCDNTHNIVKTVQKNLHEKVSSFTISPRVFRLYIRFPYVAISCMKLCLYFFNRGQFEISIKYTSALSVILRAVCMQLCFQFADEFTENCR